jgi:3-polyprenyl-4-hydroxybenzoate decarboxylase
MTPVEAGVLAKELEKHFGGTAEFEAVNNKGMYRFAITSSRFDNVPHLQRQDDIWEVVDKVLSRQSTLDVSMILAFSPADLSAIEE